MKVLKWVLRIILWLAVVILAIVGLRFLIQGGWTEFSDKFNELNKNVWSWIKWFFSTMFSKS